MEPGSNWSNWSFFVCLSELFLVFLNCCVYARFFEGLLKSQISKTTGKQFMSFMKSVELELSYTLHRCLFQNIADLSVQLVLKWRFFLETALKFGSLNEIDDEAFICQPSAKNSGVLTSHARERFAISCQR
jgi:hypothetical protein